MPSDQYSDINSKCHKWNDERSCISFPRTHASHNDQQKETHIDYAINPADTIESDL